MTTPGRRHTFVFKHLMEENMVGDTAHQMATAVPAAGPSEQRTFLKWAGWSGFIATLAFLVTGVMSSAAVSDPTGPGDMARYLGDLSDSGVLSYVYGIAGIALVVFYIPMSVGLYRLLDRSTVAWHGSAAVVFGLAVLLPAYVINLLLPFSFVPLTAEFGAAEAETLYVDYMVARGAAELFFTVGSLLSLAFGPFLWGVAWLRTLDQSRWLGWTAVVTGMTGLVWFVWLVDTDLAVLGILLIGNVLLSLVLFAGVSVVLVARGRAVREHNS